MISRSDLFLLPSLEILEAKELKAVVRKAVVAYGSGKAAARALGWSWRDMEPLLQNPELPDLPGPTVVSLSLEDIRGLSSFRVRKEIRRAVVTAVRHLGSGYDLAYFLDIREWDVRRAGMRSLSKTRA